MIEIHLSRAVSEATVLGAATGFVFLAVLGEERAIFLEFV